MVNDFSAICTPPQEVNDFLDEDETYRKPMTADRMYKELIGYKGV
jgi:hypothetical protein